MEDYGAGGRDGQDPVRSSQTEREGEDEEEGDRDLDRACRLP